MSGLTTFLTSLCAACVFIGAVHLICPDGNLGKPVKYVLSLVFLVTVISAAGLLKGGFNTDISFEASAAASDEELKAAAARYVYGEALRSCEINFSEITVCTDKNEDGSIVISKVIIYSDADKERIRVALGSAAENIEVEIINERCDK